MRATLPSHRTLQPTHFDSNHEEFGFDPEVLSPLIAAAKSSNYIAASTFGEFTNRGALYQIPRFSVCHKISVTTWLGPLSCRSALIPLKRANLF
jgi:hypothetical protein